MVVSWKEAYVLFREVMQMKIETYKGRIIYRLKSSSKRISYNRLKKGLVKTSMIIKTEVSNWLFNYSLIFVNKTPLTLCQFHLLQQGIDFSYVHHTQVWLQVLGTRKAFDPLDTAGAGGAQLRRRGGIGVARQVPVLGINRKLYGSRC